MSVVLIQVLLTSCHHTTTHNAQRKDAGSTLHVVDDWLGYVAAPCTLCGVCWASVDYTNDTRRIRREREKERIRLVFWCGLRVLHVVPNIFEKNKKGAPKFMPRSLRVEDGSHPSRLLRGCVHECSEVHAAVPAAIPPGSWGSLVSYGMGAQERLSSGSA